MNPALLALLVAASILQGWGSPVIHPAGEEHMFTKGQPVHFYCTGNHSVQWLGSTSWKKKYVSGTVTNSSFRTLKAVPGDTGTYTCVYTNSTFAGEASVHIYVKDPSNPWYVGRSGVTADKGMDVLFPCLTTDPAVTKVSLVQDGKGPVPAEATSFSPQRGITLHKVQTDQEGWYRCEGITNGVTTQSDKIELSVNVPADPPTVIIETEGYLRIPGEEFKITCKATNTVPVSVKWKHASNNAKFMKPNPHFSRGKWSDESVLQISKVETTDSGDFTCVALSDDKTTNVSTTLQVLDRGYVRLDAPGMDHSLERTLAEETLLQVQIEAYPRLLNWSWTHQRTDSLDKSSLGKLLDLKNSRYESSLTLHRPKADESGLYTFFAANSEASNSITFSVHDPPSASASLFSFNNSKELRCVASGYPTPNISWYWCSGWKESCDEEEMWPLEGANTEVSFGKAVGTLILTEIEQNATYGCTASNVVGFTRDTVKIQLAERVRERRVQHQLFSPVLATLAGMTTLFLLLLILLLYKYKQKPKYETRWQIIDACEGNNYIFIDPTQLPYNEKLEFPRSNLTFGKTLGAGAFGKVLEATAHGLGKEDATVKVAVKMLKPSAHTEEKEALMSELKIMSHLGQHENIVNLLGACTSGGPILVITEYCEQGDLLNFLRKNGESFIVKDPVTEAGLKGVSNYKNISLDKKYTRSDSGFSSQCRESYIEMRPVRSDDSTSKQGSALTEGEEEREDTKPLTLFDLLCFSSQVAQGMAFLASKNCIHRDVAARNILVTDGRIAKICDFGLARDIMNDSNYVIKGNARLPVKWMAPESIFDCIYTVQSDVWSYGILLWEIFSLGMSPYPGIVVDRKFYKLVKQGYQMARPDFAPLEIYEIMRACWDLESTHRPTFQQISLFIQEQIGREVQEYANLPCQAEVDNDPDCGSPTCDKECCEQAQVDQPLLRGNNYQFC